MCVHRKRAKYLSLCWATCFKTTPCLVVVILSPRIVPCRVCYYSLTSQVHFRQNISPTSGKRRGRRQCGSLFLPAVAVARWIWTAIRRDCRWRARTGEGDPEGAEIRHLACGGFSKSPNLRLKPIGPAGATEHDAQRAHHRPCRPGVLFARALRTPAGATEGCAVRSTEGYAPMPSSVHV